MGFSLHPRLAADTLFVVDWPSSRVLLMNDSRFPWLILVPRFADLRELYELEEGQQQAVLKESSTLGKALMAHYQGEKLNVAMLGNMVPQLHLHHVIRYASDPCWPSPIWGQGQAQAYPEAEAQTQVTRLRELLSPLVK